MRKQISLSTEIKASPDQIWRTLVDFENYPYWNPFIEYIDGDLTEGSESNASLRLSDKQYNTKLRMLKVVPDLELRLSFRKFGSFPGLLNGELIYSITPSPDNDNSLSRFEPQGRFMGIRVNEYALKKALESMSCD